MLRAPQQDGQVGRLRETLGFLDDLGLENVGPTLQQLAGGLQPEEEGEVLVHLR